MGDTDNAKTTNFRAECASCAGAAGIASCMVPMFVSAAGIAAVGLSHAGGMSGMSGGTSAASNNSFLYVVLMFFLGFWGEVILLASFALMVFGMWYGKRFKPMIVGTIAAIILFVGMYPYYSIPLEIVGSVVLMVAYAAAYSYRFRTFTGLCRA